MWAFSLLAFALTVGWLVGVDGGLSLRVEFSFAVDRRIVDERKLSWWEFLHFKMGGVKTRSLLVEDKEQRRHGRIERFHSAGSSSFVSNISLARAKGIECSCESGQRKCSSASDGLIGRID